MQLEIFRTQKYWTFPKEFLTCPKCGGAILQLIEETNGYKKVVKRKCNGYGLYCDWSEIVDGEQNDT